jgi:hypothetical protein
MKDSSDPETVGAAEEKPSKKNEKGEAKGERNKSSDPKLKKRLSKGTVWTIKVLVLTFVLSGAFSYLSEITTKTAPLAVALLLLIMLIVISIIFDAVAIAVTSCELAPLLSMAARKVKGSKTAVKLVKNCERVNNICGDVIGDICGIISGACTVAVVFKVMTSGNFTLEQRWLTILLSSVVAAVTVGGKAFFKEIAIKNAKEIVLFVSRILSVFSKEK